MLEFHFLESKKKKKKRNNKIQYFALTLSLLR